MRIVKVITITLVLILGILTPVHAESASVQFKGNKEVIAETETTIAVEISNNTAIGVINGVINYNSNIKDVKINSSHNGWMVTYNEETGRFNALKAEGTTKGEVLQITYKLKENATQGSITLKDIELTTIEYETIKIDNNVTATINKKIENKSNVNTNTNTNKTTNTTVNTTVNSAAYRSYTEAELTSKGWKSN